MRLAISTITRKGGRDRALHTAAFVRTCLAGNVDLNIVTCWKRIFTRNKTRLQHPCVKLKMVNYKNANLSWCALLIQIPQHSMQFVFVSLSMAVKARSTILLVVSHTNLKGLRMCRTMKGALDDDVFTSDALDNIPALNQAPSPVTPVAALPSSAVQQPPQIASTSLSIPGSNASNPIVVGSVNDLNQFAVLYHYERSQEWIDSTLQ
ncbi:hypothetical protein AG1IA_10025 [Rhizoctonia solani AG-1 IA]|uniref:Uncharacterized protein n=1 Tax=Thanatephorus cucumeris (strain AG1-IA) TaxID=983506 RepID=L8WDA8_THACA|nr:hypothetical protein AG1IA_10025 [Rhizoctonia solani AG-1 IA]